MTATDALRNGMAAFNAGRYAEAASLFAPAARAGDARAAVFLAHAEAAAGRPRAALSVLERSTRRHPRDAGLRVAAGDLLRSLGRFEPALRAYRGAAALPGGAARGRVGAAVCLERLGRRVEAASAWRLAVAAAPGDDAARGGLAEALFASGDMARAAEQAALLRAPRPGLLAAAVRALTASGRQGSAVRALRRAARARPADPGPPRLMGEVLLVGGRPAAARPWLARAARPGGLPSLDRYAALILLGRAAAAGREGGRLARLARTQLDYDLLFNPLALTRSWRAPRGLAERLGRGSGPWPAMFRLSLRSMGGAPSEASGEAARLRSASRKTAWMRYLCGHLELQTTGDAALAEADFRAALAAAPGLWKAEAYVAEMALVRGRAAEAWRRMRVLTARLSGPELADALAWRGAMLLWVGRAREAERALVRACAGGAQFGRGWLGAAEVLSGRPREGLADLDAALSGRAPEEEALVWRAEAWAALGRPERARRDLAAALSVNPRSDWARLVRARLDAEAGRDASWVREEVRPELLRRLRLLEGPLDARALRSAFRRARGLRRSAAYLAALLP